MNRRVPDFGLFGRAALVTGGAGILGRRLCHGLAAQGARVAVLDLNGRSASALAEELHDAYGSPTLGLEADVSSPESCQEAVAEVETELGPLRILCNNAATKGDNLADFFEPFETYSLKTWRSVCSVNLDGAFLMAQSAGRAMLAHGLGGSVIQTSSIYGVVAADPRIYEGSEYLGRPINTPAVYAATKAAVVGLTLHLAAHWGDRGIRVNAVAPGGISSGQNEIFEQRYSARVPLGRMAGADEMVGAVCYLASDAASYVTGQTLVVDGGLTAW